MKKVILLSVCGASMLMAGFSEHAYLYKDSRIMGMGGANVAVGGYSSSVFQNPAGLRSIRVDHGLEVELLGLTLQGSQGIKDFADDLDAADTDPELADVLKKYSGDHFNVNVNNYSSVSNNNEDYAWSIGILASVDANFFVHGNGGSNDLLETHSRGYGGLVAAYATSFPELGPGTLDVGISAKYIKQTSVEGGLGITELLDNKDDLGNYLQDKYQKDASGWGVDLGIVYKLYPDNYFHPAFGLSVLNLGDMGMDDNYGRQPTTVNVGASISPELPFFEHFILAVDYVDLLNANETRFYDFTETGGVVTDVSYTDFEESDFTKRLRLGVSAGIFDNSWFLTTLNAGLYQGNYTLGADIQATVFKFSAATYAEEIGPEAGDLTDRRYMFTLGIGW